MRELLDAAGTHHGDPRRPGHRLDLVVRHIDDRRAEFLVQALELDAHLGAQLGIQVGQRLVEQKDLGLLHQRAADRDALALAAGELRRLAIEQVARSAAARPPSRRGVRSPPAAPSAPAGRTRCSCAPSWSDRARRTGTPWRCRARCGSRCVTSVPSISIVAASVISAGRRSRSAAWTCRNRTGRAAR